MKVKKLNDIPKQVYEHPIFTGGAVNRQPIVTGDMTNALEMTNVHFSKGARCRFHTHTVDQVLVVTSGTGIVATEDEEVIVTVGDVIELLDKGEEAVMSIRNFGEKSLDELHDKMVEKGYIEGEIDESEAE